MAQLNYDVPGRLDIRVGKRHSFIWQMTQYEDDAETIPMDFTGTHKIVLTTDEDGDDIAYTFDLAHSMTIVGNVMTIDFTTSLNTLMAPEYFLDWRSDDNTDHSVHIAHGKAYFNNTQAKP